MRRYTDVVIPVAVKGFDISAADRIEVTITQGMRQVSVQPTNVAYDGTDTTMDVELDQRQTSAFSAGRDEGSPGKAQIQVNWWLQGRRNATKAKETEIRVNLLERVIDA